MFLLKTDWGGERLRRKLVASTNQQIQGQLGIGRLSFGGNRLVVWDVALRDPEGQPVAQVARAEVTFQLLRLLRKEIRLTSIAIEGPHLGLLSDSRGLNLSRATTPRKKNPAEPPAKEKSTEEGWVVRLDRFDLTGGLLTVGTAGATATEERVHLADLVSFMSGRFATGNGSLDLHFRLNGRSRLVPVGPFGFLAEAHVKEGATRFSMDADLLGGTIKARGDVPSEGLERPNVVVKVAIPKQNLAGFEWGPFRIDGQALPGAIPKLDVLLAIPGVEFSGKNVNATAFDFNGRLTIADLAVTGKAVHALTGGDPPSVAGQGHIAFTVGGPVGGPMKGAPSTWSTRWTGQFDRIRLAENAVNGLSIDGRVTPLVNPPSEVDFKLAIAAVTAGTMKLGKVNLEAKVRQQDITAGVQVASPQQITLTLAGRLDDDQQGFTLKALALAFPQAHWALEKRAQMRFSGESLSLTTLVLLSQEQRLSIEGSKAGELINAHLAIDKLRLDLLPALVVDPDLRVAGILDVDVKAEGEVSNPKVVAGVVLKHAHFQGFSRLYAKVDATLEEQIIEGTVSLEAPFAAVEGRVKLPVQPLVPDAPLDMRFDVTRLDLGEALRAAAVAAPVDGRLTSRLQLTGTADSPKVDVTLNAKDLAVSRPATPTKGADVIDVGQAKIHLTYARRSVGANIDFTSSHGGTLKVDADGRVDLSYPRVTRGIVAAKIPINGKVVAKDFDVAWISRFNERVETLGGQVNADAKLAGTVGEPEFIGDVRWKNGKLVATVPQKPATVAKRSVGR